MARHVGTKRPYFSKTFHRKTHISFPEHCSSKECPPAERSCTMASHFVFSCAAGILRRVWRWHLLLLDLFWTLEWTLGRSSYPGRPKVATWDGYGTFYLGGVDFTRAHNSCSRSKWNRSDGAGKMWTLYLRDLYPTAVSFGSSQIRRCIASNHNKLNLRLNGI